MRTPVNMIGLISLVLVLISPAVLAQESRNPGTTLSGQITGQVRYAEGGQPAFNVLVSCDSFNGGLIGQELTDRTGRFRFAGLAPSQYNVTVRVAGFVEEKQTVELLTTPSANIQFQLRSDGTPRTAVAGVIDTSVPAAARKEFEQATAGLATGKKEKLEESARHLEKALTIYPNFVQAELMLGTIYMDLGQWDKAESALKRTIELDPKAANALLAMGDLYLRQKKLDDAEKVLLQGLDIEPRSYQGHLTLARLYWEQSSKISNETQARPTLEKSYEEVKKALELNPNFGEAHLLKGNLMLRVGRAADAQHEFEEYLSLDPKGRFADQARATIEKIKKALESGKKG
jgi:tetratricopeptide (TPR) repeat protein